CPSTQKDEVMALKRTTMVCVAACLFAFLACQEEQNPAKEKASANLQSPLSGFTGTDVPALAPMLGDYVNIGVRTPENRTDIPRLLAVLKEASARDYMHLVWNEKLYPDAWQDFRLMAPEFEKAGINLWLYLTPPSEGAPEPFGDDYVTWAVECAKVAQQYPVVKGICLDDFNENVANFTPSYCREMMSAAHKIAPHLSFLVVGYFGYENSIAPHVEAGVIDGVIFPYFFPHKNLSDTSQLRPQINTYRTWLDQHAGKGGLSKKMPLIVMVYAVKHSQSADSPTPAYVKKCLEIGLEATREGLASGVVTYCLPKDNPEFVKRAAEVYRVWASVNKRP
ncbi:MAG: hypothetical protein WCI75_18550, partial [candidate division NC10 bacterium]